MNAMTQASSVTESDKCKYAEPEAHKHTNFAALWTPGFTVRWNQETDILQDNNLFR